MLSVTNVLVCSDFSRGSDLALSAAGAIRGRTAASLHVLHVSELPMMWESPMKELMSQRIDQKVELELMSSADKKLKEQMAARHAEGLIHVRMGSAHQMIHTFVRENIIDLVIMGHKGRGSSAFYIGGLASKIVSSSSVPVLIAKKELTPIKVAGLVDPTAPMKEILSTAEYLAKTFTCPLEIVSLFPDIGARYAGMGRPGFSTRLLSLTEEQRNEIKKHLKDHIRQELGPETSATIKIDVTIEKKIAYHLNAILTDDFTDLVVMKRHQSAFLEKILIGSETRRMIELFEGNILVLPP